MSVGAAYVRLAAALGALAAGAVAVVTIALLLHRTPGPVPSASAAPAAPPASSTPAAPTASGSLPNAIATPTSPGFPAPPAGAVVFSREDGADAVGLAVLPRDGGLMLRASVVGQSGSGVRGLAVRFRVEGAGSSKTATGAACGAGCYEARVAWHGRPERVLVRIGARSLAFEMPDVWPPRAAERLVARAAQVWRKLHTLVSHERLASDPQHGVTTVWRFAAPDRLSYNIVGGPSAVVIGNRRWDLVPGSRWQASPQEPLRMPVPLWTGVSDARVLGTERVRGHAAWRISFFDPQLPAWFTVLIDRATFRTLDVRMVATAHFMHDVYGSFDRPLAIVPPLSTGGKR